MTNLLLAYFVIYTGNRHSETIPNKQNGLVIYVHIVVAELMLRNKQL